MRTLVSHSNDSIRDPLFVEASVDMDPSRSIHRCLESIWERLHLRARLFLQEGGALVLRDYVGAYHSPLKVGLSVHPESIVWEIFRKGKPLNLTASSDQRGRPHTLPEPVIIKAVIPLRGEDPQDGRGLTHGVLVVDAGDSPEPIDDRDFQYLKVLGMLINEILQRSVLLERIRQIQKERENMTLEVAHIFRNRLIVIGGFARRLGKVLLDPNLRRWTRIILDEVEKGERALEHWIRSIEKEEGDSEK
jgi:signal transduction histidine kinase